MSHHERLVAFRRPDRCPLEPGLCCILYLVLATCLAALVLPTNQARAQLPCESIETRSDHRVGRFGSAPTEPTLTRWQRRYRYDRDGRVTEVRIERLDPGAGPGSDRFQFRYDQRGLLLEMIVNGTRTRIVRDTDGVVTTIRQGPESQGRWFEVRLEWEGSGTAVLPQVDLTTLVVFGWSSSRLNDFAAAMLQGGREGVARPVRYSCTRARGERTPTCTLDPVPGQGLFRYDSTGRLVELRTRTERWETTLTFEYVGALPQARRIRTRLNAEGASDGQPQARELRFEFGERGITNAPGIGRLERDAEGRIVQRGGNTEFSYRCGRRSRRRR